MRLESWRRPIRALDPSGILKLNELWSASTIGALGRSHRAVKISEPSVRCQRRGFSDATLSLKRQNFSLIGPIGIPCQEQPYFFPEVLTGME